jgi:hypothetical protein
MAWRRTPPGLSREHGRIEDLKVVAAEFDKLIEAEETNG